jgi:hypothetical protein
MRKFITVVVFQIFGAESSSYFPIVVGRWLYTYGHEM